MVKCLKYMLIHEMIHFYLRGHTLSYVSKPMERYELNRCVDLDKGLSLRNPRNYEAYVASKFVSVERCGTKLSANGLW